MAIGARQRGPAGVPRARITCFSTGPLAALTGHSALARRVDSLLRVFDPEASGERPKPDYDLAWPAGVAETDPDLASPDLPVNLPAILADLERIRGDLAGVGASLVMTSFQWLVTDGMQLDPVRHRSIHDCLNVGFYPVRYRDMERLSRFQNRVFRKYADRHGLHFIDVAGSMPPEPDLFIDAIHNTYAGVRLRAWTVFQGLLPLVDRMIADGHLPRAPQSALPSPWTGTDPIRTMQMNCVSRAIDKAPELPADGWSASDARTMLDRTWGGAVDVTTDGDASHYSAELLLPAMEPEVPVRYQVRLSGDRGTAIVVNVLAGDRSRFWAQREVVLEGSDIVEVQLVAVPADAEQPFLLITNGPQAGTIRYRIHSTRMMVDRREPVEVVADGIRVPPP